MPNPQPANKGTTETPASEAPATLQLQARPTLRALAHLMGRPPEEVNDQVFAPDLDTILTVRQTDEVTAKFGFAVTWGGMRYQERERNVKIEFEGFGVDLFRTETGYLGLTIEHADPHPDPRDILPDVPSIDLFVSPDLGVHGEGIKMLPDRTARRDATWAQSSAGIAAVQATAEDATTAASPNAAWRAMEEGFAGAQAARDTQVVRRPVTLSRLLLAVIEHVQIMPISGGGGRRILDILSALHGYLTEEGTTGEQDTVLEEIGVRLAHRKSPWWSCPYGDSKLWLIKSPGGKVRVAEVGMGHAVSIANGGTFPLSDIVGGLLWAPVTIPK